MHSNIRNCKEMQAEFGFTFSLLKNSHSRGCMLHLLSRQLQMCCWQKQEVDASPHFPSKNGVSLMLQLWREVLMRYFKHESHEKVQLSIDYNTSVLKLSLIAKMVKVRWSGEKLYGVTRIWKSKSFPPSSALSFLPTPPLTCSMLEV